MLIQISLNDYKDEYWELQVPTAFKRNKHGMWIMWAYVTKGPPSLKDYQEIPLPVFTEWWDDAIIRSEGASQ